MFFYSLCFFSRCVLFFVDNRMRERVEVTPTWLQGKDLPQVVCNWATFTRWTTSVANPSRVGGTKSSCVLCAFVALCERRNYGSFQNLCFPKNQRPRDSLRRYLQGNQVLDKSFSVICAFQFLKNGPYDIRKCVSEKRRPPTIGSKNTEETRKKHVCLIMFFCSRCVLFLSTIESVNEWK